MYAFMILIALALALVVVHRTVDELVPVKVPAALTRSFIVLVAIGIAWLLDYSVFAAFGQDLRAAWMHPVMTGLVLVAFGEFATSVVNAIAHRAGEPPVEVSPTFPRAA
jgi:fatty-acid desaturase